MRSDNSGHLSDLGRGHGYGIAKPLEPQTDQCMRWKMENSSIVMETETSEWTTQYNTGSGYDREGADKRTLRSTPKNRIPNTGPMGVLIVDDNRLNGAAIRRSFSALKASIPVFEVRTCGEALDALYGVHPRISVLPPCIVVLNLDMPGSFGFLNELRREPDHLVRNSTVFVHSKSNSIPDRNRAYEWNIAGYIHDRPGRKSLLSLAQLLREYIQAVELPNYDESIDRCDMPSRRIPGCGVEAPPNVRFSSIPSSPDRASTRLELVI
jgi:CheY-like chemotaxis protein